MKPINSNRTMVNAFVAKKKTKTYISLKILYAQKNKIRRIYQPLVMQRISLKSKDFQIPRPLEGKIPAGHFLFFSYCNIRKVIRHTFLLNDAMIASRQRV